MCSVFLPIFVFLFTFSGCFSKRWIAEENIKAFGMYRDVTLTRYDIPEGASSVTFDFRPRRTQSKCEEIPIHVVLQYGSIPTVNPINETYPKHFYLKTFDEYHILLVPNNASQKFAISSPRPGSWYSAIYRPPDDGKIVQKGLFSRCSYLVSQAYDVEDDRSYQPLSPAHSNKLTLNTNITKYIKFDINSHVYKYTIAVDDCDGDCDIEITYLNTQRNLSLPNSVNCSTSDPCQLGVTSPDVSLDQRFSIISRSGNSSLDVTVNIKLEECDYFKNSNHSNSSCLYFDKLDRLQFTSDFTAGFVYIVNDTVKPVQINVTKDFVNVVPFYIQPSIDIGGTLTIEMGLHTYNLNSSIQYTRVCAGVYNNYIDGDTVDNDEIRRLGNSLCSNNSKPGSDLLNFPYPQPSTWYLVFTVDCFTGNDTAYTKEKCVNDTYRVGLSVTTGTCARGGCNGRGECKEYISSPSLIIYSTCVCSAGWRGFGCTDDRDAFTAARQLTEVFLLTLSNLFFLPGIILALKRRYYVEALVYTYNMVFSTFYHACDGDREAVYTLCIMKYNVLSFCDFLGSVCSLWVTVIAMARVYKPVTVLLQMAAPLFLVIGVLYDRTSLLIIAVPGAVALGLLAISWTHRCYQRKTCYPTWKRYLLFLLPGVVIATTGAMLFAFAETASNYLYTHSVWHMTLSLSIIFLLPPRVVKKDAMSQHEGNGLSIIGSENSDVDSGVCLIRPVNSSNLVL